MSDIQMEEELIEIIMQLSLSLSLSLSSEVELPNYLIILYSLPQLGLPRKYDYYMIY